LRASKATEFSKAKEFTEALRLYREAIAIAEVCRGLETLAFCNVSVVTVVVLKFKGLHATQAAGAPVPGVYYSWFASVEM